MNILFDQLKSGNFDKINSNKIYYVKNKPGIIHNIDQRNQLFYIISVKMDIADADKFDDFA